MHGTWTITSTGYAKTFGDYHKLSTVIEKHAVSDDYVFEVKMKRKFEENSSNRIYLNGFPHPLTEEKFWYEGYFFGYYGQYWGLWRVDGDDATILLVGTSPYLKPLDWNTLTVYANAPWIDLWINGHYLGCIGPIYCAVKVDTIITGGYVGFGMYEVDTKKSPLLVDIAKVYYSKIPPYPIGSVEYEQRFPTD